jgi:hypothetical protein
MRVLIFIFGLLFLHTLHAQDYVKNIRGKVLDKDSKSPLIGVNVLIVNSTPPTGTSTNEKGEFVLENVRAGRHTIKLTYVGYQEVVLSEILVSTGKETFLNIEMQEMVLDRDAIEIVAQKDKSRANNEFASVSVRSFSVEDTKRYAGTLNDPARMAQSFAGVLTANDENNAIVVRGNSPRGLLWRMEGVEIPNPNHFAGDEGSTGGGVSILSSNMLSNTDFYTGGFPAEFGNAVSGVFDLNLRKGNSSKREYTIQLGVLGLEAALEGPFSKKYDGSYLLNYRYSTLELLSYTGINIGGNVFPKYQDLAFNINLPAGKAGKFAVFGMWGLSSLGSKAKRDINKWETFSDKTDYNQKQMVGVAGLTHLISMTDGKTYFKTTISYSATDKSYSEDSLDNSFEKFNISKNKFTNQYARISASMNRKIDSKNLFRTGAYFTYTWFNLYSEQFNFFSNSTKQNVSNKGATQLWQGYMQWKHRFTDFLQLNTGIHFTYSQINNKFYAEPRAGFEWTVKENHTLSAGVGMHSRTDAISTYVSFNNPTARYNIQTNRNLDFTRAVHAVLGYNFNFLKDFRLKTEVYYQYLFSIPVGTDSANASYAIINYNDGFVNIPLQSSGIGYNTGIELTLEKFFTKNYYFMLTASVFDSRYKAKDGKWHNTTYNSNYVLNALGGKEFVVGKRKINIIGINAKIIYRGGQRITPIDLEKSIETGQTVENNTRAFEEKLPDYFRIDFGTSFRRNKKKYSWVLSFDAQNVINRQNVARKVYDASKQSIRVEKSLGIVPVLSWKVEF